MALSLADALPSEQQASISPQTVRIFMRRLPGAIAGRRAPFGATIGCAGGLETMLGCRACSAERAP